MAERSFEIALPEEILDALGYEDAELPAKVRETLVMELLREDKISEGQAAQALGLDRWALLETMGRYRAPTVRISAEELQRELKAGLPTSPTQSV